MKTAPPLHSFLEDESGGYSHRRLLTMLWFAMMIALISWLTIKKKEMPVIPDNIMWLSLGFLGFGVASKYVEKKPVAELFSDLTKPNP